MKVETQTIDQYIARFPKAVQEILQKLRMLIKDEVPDAGEKISYGIPTFTLEGTYFIYMAGYKNHVISIYPATEELPKELCELLQYKTGKGTFQFKLDTPIPYDLIRKFTIFRVNQHNQKTKER